MSIKLEKFIDDNINEAIIHAYSAYWESIKPHHYKDHLKRWLFALMSVHTTWENNVKGYNAIKGMDDWIHDRDKLNQHIKNSKTGLNVNRSKGIWEIATKFNNEKSRTYYNKRNDEDWQQYRNRIADDTFFLGLAKTSFAITMCNPTESKVVCLDTHLLQFCGWKKNRNPSKKEYIEMENDWLNVCEKRKLPPGIVREIYWDKVQHKNNSRYWSYCLEDSYEKNSKQKIN